MDSSDLKTEALKVITLYKACVEAWRAHPQYDGNDKYPHIRAVCRTRGPESLSYSIDTIEGAHAQFRRMAKQRIIAEEFEFAIEPIQPYDWVHPYCVVDCWNFPTKAGAKYAAKKRFRELFPDLRPALTHACRIIREPAHRHPDRKWKEKKEFTFKMWMSRQSKLAKAAYDLLISPADIWEVANGKLPIKEVERLGIPQFPLIAECDSLNPQVKAAGRNIK